MICVLNPGLLFTKILVIVVQHVGIVYSSVSVFQSAILATYQGVSEEEAFIKKATIFLTTSDLPQMLQSQQKRLMKSMDLLDLFYHILLFNFPRVIAIVVNSEAADIFLREFERRNSKQKSFSNLVGMAMADKEKLKLKSRHQKRHKFRNLTKSLIHLKLFSTPAASANLKTESKRNSEMHQKSEMSSLTFATCQSSPSCSFHSLR